MLREIRKKMVILRNRIPFPQQVKDHLNEVEYREWIHGNLRLSGTSLTEEQIDAILNEEVILQAAVEDYLRIERLGELRSYIYRLTDMGAVLSTQIIRDMHAILTGRKQEEFRRGGIMMESYGRYNPLIGTDIPEAMTDVVRYAVRKEDGENPFEKAAKVHHRMIEIYPFQDENETLALAVLYYILAEAGFPMAMISLTAEEYRHMVKSCLDGGSSAPLARLLESAVLHRFEVMMELTAH